MAICDDRTIIITGAGGGLGRAHAQALAQAGANVVVNDIQTDAAQAVVDDITAGGGSALANGGDITTIDGAQTIVAAAEQAFGTVHGVVNNAGVVRDRMFVKMTESEWDDVMRVHLRGHFCLANVLANRWRDAAKAGEDLDARIVNTTSGAGLQGSIGQSNYSAAKGGIATLTLVQAAELGRYGVRANAVAPAARTSMTQGPFGEVMKKPEDGSFDFFDPANVSPLIVWLCSTASDNVNGRVFEAQGGEISVSDGWRPAAKKDKGARWQAQELTQAVEQLLAEAPDPIKVYGT